MHAFVCILCTGEVISEGIDDAEDSGYHAERDDLVSDEDHIAAVSTKGKTTEVQVLVAVVAYQKPALSKQIKCEFLSHINTRKSLNALLRLVL